MDRRRFLVRMGALGVWTAFGPIGPFGPVGPARSASACSAVEHSAAISEILFVYDQASGPHLLREIVAIVRHLPPATRVYVLVSSARAREAESRLRSFGLENLQLLVSEQESVSGDWGCDILQRGCGVADSRLLCVPWNKTATTREDLLRGFRQLEPLEEYGYRVRLLPVAAEGGNLHIDETGAGTVAFAGTTIAVETRAMYRSLYGTDPGDEGVAAILRDGLEVDEVVWLGPRRAGAAARQADLLFHIDMGCTLVAPGRAVVARCDPEALPVDDHLEILQREAARTVAALTRRGVTPESWPAGLDLPAKPGEREEFLELRRVAEHERIEAAAREMEGLAAALDRRGYEIHRLPTDPRRVRRFQSHTNVIPSRDRLLMPLFPVRENVHGWLVHGERGRDAVDVELGLADSDFELSGDNLAAYELYGRLHDNVRTVRDYFYLAGGNVHCVTGRLS